MRSIKYLLLSIVLFSFVQNTNFQIEEYQAKFIHGFTKFIEWPGLENQLAFKIGVLGKDHPIVPFLKRANLNKTVMGKPISIVVFESVDELTACHILFVPNRSIGFLRKASQFLLGVPVLIVTEVELSMPTQSMINLSIEEEMFGFRLNQAKAEEAGLKLSQQLIERSRK